MTKTDNLEHIIQISDIQDFGGIENNLSVLSNVSNFVKKKFEDSKTSIFLLGDLLDQHSLYSIHYSPEELAEKNSKLITNDFIKSLPPEYLDKLKQMSQDKVLYELLPQIYFEKSTKILKDLKSSFSKTYAVTGNNEVPLLFGKVDKSNLESLTSEYRKIFTQTTGIDFIDDGKVKEIAGQTIYSRPHWEVIYNDGNALNQSFDSNNLSESIIYQDLSKISKGERPNVLALHGPPNVNEDGSLSGGLGKAISEYDGPKPLIVMCGHSDKAGISVTKNSNGKSVIYVNSNNSPNGGVNPEGTFYDLQVKNGFVKTIVEYSYSYN